LAAWGALATLVIVSRPLESPDLWWDLARGREVAASWTFHPSQNLLILDHTAEAAWLGVSSFAKLWSIGGIFALAAVPLVTAWCLRWAIVRNVSIAKLAVAVVAILPLAVLATRSELEPTSRLFDLLYLSALWLVLLHRGESIRILWWLGGLFVLWANSGPRPLWGLAFVVLWPGVLRHRTAAVLVSLLAGMATPRGPLNWLDSTILIAPAAFVPQSELEPRWQSALTGGWDPALAAAAILWIFAVVAVARLRSLRSLADWAIVAVPVVAVLLSQSNIAVAALWTMLYWLTLTRRDEAPAPANRPRWVRPAMALATALVVVDACGMLSPTSQTMGWGLSQAIDPRLLEIGEFIPGNEPAISWAADSRSAGVAAWANTKTKLIDHPTRALLGGRLALHAGIRRDLASAHRSAYRLDDGSWGGWGRPFADWKVEVLFVTGEAADVHRGLLETPWKLMKLDSPTAPYASAENPRFDRAVVDVIRQQGFVETGGWQPTIDVYDPHGWRVDVSSVVGLGPISSPAIRQSQFFRGVKLPMAAMRALGPVRSGGGTSAVREEFLKCQEALALEEYNAAGQVSVFRRLALDVAGVAESESDPWRPTTWAYWFKTPQQWRESRDLYRSGQIPEAIEALSGDSSNEAYARGLMFLETGQVDLARTAFETALHDKDPAVKISAGYWLNQISPAKNTSVVLPLDSVAGALVDRGGQAFPR
jgi:hypothetical protein